MRILGVVLLVALLASLGIGLLACVPVEVPPGVAATPTPTATPRPQEFTGAPAAGTATPPGGFAATPTPVTPRPGTTATTTTKDYIMSGNMTEKLALRNGDVVILTVTTTAVTVGVMVDDPKGGPAVLRTAVRLGETRKISFQAKMDGDHTLTLYAGVASGPTGNTAKVVTEIYR